MKINGKNILPATPKKKAKVIKLAAEKKQPMEHWKEIVETWFTFCQEKFSQKPSFDGISAKSLKLLMTAIKLRATDQKVEWNSIEACARLRAFLLKAHRDQWMRDNFLLKNLNSQKDKFFFQKDNNNGRTSNEVVGKTIVFDRP